MKTILANYGPITGFNDNSNTTIVSKYFVPNSYKDDSVPVTSEQLAQNIYSQSNNLGYGLGRFLYIVYQYIDSAFSFPTVSAVTTRNNEKRIVFSKKQQKSLEPIDDLVRKFFEEQKITFHVDKEIALLLSGKDNKFLEKRKKIESELNDFISSFFDTMKLTALEGPKAMNLIKECLENLSGFQVMHQNTLSRRLENVNIMRKGGEEDILITQRILRKKTAF